MHRSTAIVLPAVLRRAALPTDADAGEPAELLTETFRAVGSEDTWVVLCEPEDIRSRFQLSYETAHRLGAALRDLTAD